MLTKCKFCLILLFYLFSSYCFAEDNKVKITNSHLYKNFAIFTVENHNKFGGLVNQKIIIQANTAPAHEYLTKGIKNLPEYGPILWEITGDQLPVSDDNCLSVDSGTCLELAALNKETCYPPCIMFGPKFLGFDEKARKLYLMAYSTMIGNAGSELFSFIADLDKKEIKFFQIIDGHVEGYLSPDGKYLALLSVPFFQGQTVIVYDTKSGKKLEVLNKLDTYVNKLEWITENKLQIEFKEYTSAKPKKIFERKKVFDIEL